MSRSQQKGTSFETLIARGLAEALDDDRIERRTRNGVKDRGDIGGVRAFGKRVVIECKAEATGKVVKLPEWVKEAREEADNDGALVGLVVHKRSGTTDPLRQWVSFTVEDLCKILIAARSHREEGELLCGVRDCGRAAYSKGEPLCSMHWQRQRAGRDMLSPPPYLREVTWSGVHQRLEALWGPASHYRCVFCDGEAREWAYDGTDPVQKIGPAGHLQRQNTCWFSSWPEFYMPLCRKCHRTRDAAAVSAELREYREWKAGHPGLQLNDLDLFLTGERQ